LLRTDATAGIAYWRLPKSSDFFGTSYP